jgi:ATP phosphoribosyltransferase
MEEMVRKVMGEMMITFTSTLKSELNEIKKSLDWSDRRCEETAKLCELNTKKTERMEMEMKRLKKELDLEKSKRLDLEIEQKKLNIIVYGLPELVNGEETPDVLERKVQTWLKSDLHIESCSIDYIIIPQADIVL